MASDSTDLRVKRANAMMYRSFTWIQALEQVLEIIVTSANVYVQNGEPHVGWLQQRTTKKEPIHLGLKVGKRFVQMGAPATSTGFG